MSTIPDEIKQKIDDEADKYGFVVPYDGSDKFYNDDRVKGFQDGATFGYSLALSEIERLKGLLEKEFKMFRDVDSVDRKWLQFCTDNKIK